MIVLLLGAGTSARPWNWCTKLEMDLRVCFECDISDLVLSLVFFSLAFLSSLTSAPGSAPMTSTVPYVANNLNGGCNVFEKPGFLSHEPYPVWKAFDASCTSPTLLPDLLAVSAGSQVGPAAHLRSPVVSPQAQIELQRTLRNRTVLIVGDAVDRMMVADLCNMLGQRSVSVDASHLWGSALKSVPGGFGHDASNALLADYCYVPSYDALFTSFYHYGADTSDIWRSQSQYFPPGPFEARTASLLKPYLEAMSSPKFVPNLPPARRSTPDLVVFSSSLWDLAMWAMKDASKGVQPTSDLSATVLAWWRGRMVDMIENLRTYVGSAPIVWRSAHYAQPRAEDSVEWLLDMSMQVRSTTPTGRLGHSFASMNRIAQLNRARQATLHVSGRDLVRGDVSKVSWTPGRQPALRDMPWGEVTLGEARSGATLLSPGTVPHSFMYWSMVLAELRNAVL